MYREIMMQVYLLEVVCKKLYIKVVFRNFRKKCGQKIFPKKKITLLSEITRRQPSQRALRSCTIHFVRKMLCEKSSTQYRHTICAKKLSSISYLIKFCMYRKSYAKNLLFQVVKKELCVKVMYIVKVMMKIYLQ